MIKKLKLLISALLLSLLSPTANAGRVSLDQITSSFGTGEAKLEVVFERSHRMDFPVPPLHATDLRVALKSDRASIEKLPAHLKAKIEQSYYVYDGVQWRFKSNLIEITLECDSYRGMCRGSGWNDFLFLSQADLRELHHTISLEPVEVPGIFYFANRSPYAHLILPATDLCEGRLVRVQR